MVVPTYTYENFPENTASCEGMQIIDGQDETGVSCKQDVVYAVKDGMALHLKMMFPSESGKDKKYPTVFHVQGSAFFKQNLHISMGTLMPLVRAGYGVIIIEYRCIPRHRFPCQIEDGKTAVRYVMDHTQEYPIDTNNLYLSGDSSGGYTAMMMMATWGSRLCDAEGTPLPRLNACIDLYGSLNMLTMNNAPSAYNHNDMDSPASIYLGFPAKTNPKECLRQIPYTYIDESTPIPPVLIMHGSKDRTVPFTQSLEFYQHLKKHHKEAEFFKVRGADHGDNIFYCQAVMQTIIDFLNRHLR